jgi:two-component system, LytTR family, response regulator
MRALVIDDEPLVRTALAKLLSSRADIDEFELAQDAIQALALLGKRTFDVLMVDIHMPEMSGLQFVEQLSQQGATMPSVIFITAYHEHAVEAFRKRAVDYVLKPFDAIRVHDALDVAVRRSSQERAERVLGMLKDLRIQPKRANRIAIKDKGRVVFVDVAEIMSVEAKGNYVLLQHKAGSFLLRETIAEIAEKLKSHGFIRIHRSVLINSQFVETIEPGVGSEYLLRTKMGKDYHVTRTYRDNLRDLADLWIGSAAFHFD